LTKLAIFSLKKFILEAFTAQELANILSDRLKIDKIGDEIQTAFQLFDSNEKGFINVEDLKRVAEELGEELNEDEFKVFNFIV